MLTCAGAYRPYPRMVVATLVALIVPLGLDSFAAAATLGLGGLTARERWRISLLFAAFEGAMPVIGLLLGASVGHAVGAVAQYVAVAVLLALGLWGLWGETGEKDADVRELLRTPGVGALLLGLSVSLDELAIGFTLGLLRLPAVLVVVLIAVQAFVVAQVGIRVGARLGERVREGAERLAGAALLALGSVLLVEKLLA